MSKTLSKNLMIMMAAILAVALFAFVLAPASLADADEASGVAAAVEKTYETVSAKLDEVKTQVSEKIGVDAETIEYIWNYGDNVENGVEAATDDFVAMIEGIGDAYDKGDVEGILNTPQTFVDGLKTYLGSIKDTVIP